MKKKLNVLGHGDCHLCARPMRPANWTLDEAPGTIPHHAKGVCTSCAKRQARGLGNTEYKPRERPKECIDCGRDMRPRMSRAADHPGTVEHRGNGRCQTCGIRRLRNMKQQPAPTAKPQPEPIAGADPALDSFLARRRAREARQKRLEAIKRTA